MTPDPRCREAARRIDEMYMRLGSKSRIDQLTELLNQFFAPPSGEPGCDLCGDQAPLLLHARCHLTAPLAAMLEGETLVLKCYVPECSREVTRFRVVRAAPPSGEPTPTPQGGLGWYECRRIGWARNTVLRWDGHGLYTMSPGHGMRRHNPRDYTDFIGPLTVATAGDEKLREAIQSALVQLRKNLDCNAISILQNALDGVETDSPREALAPAARKEPS